ncbi:MAG: DNA topoisomerase IB [Amaricoccus sp.]
MAQRAGPRHAVPEGDQRGRRRPPPSSCALADATAGSPEPGLRAAASDTPPGSPEAAAAEVGLVHGSDTEPGIRRHSSAAGFTFTWPNGSRVTDPRVLDRIRALVIPPAWSDVWIAQSPDSHLQVTGKDARGRKQYRYHERWAACRDEVKYTSLVEFARALPKLRRTVEADLVRRGLPREKVLATVVWLLDNTLIRVGNPGYARDNRSYGLTTLRDRHVRIEGSSLRFRFTGKSGKSWNLKVSDRRIARIVRQARDLPGQVLFQYLGEDADQHSVASQDVNAYIRAAGGGPFSSKHSAPGPAPFARWTASRCFRLPRARPR